MTLTFAMFPSWMMPIAGWVLFSNHITSILNILFLLNHSFREGSKVIGKQNGIGYVFIPV